MHNVQLQKVAVFEGMGLSDAELRAGHNERYHNDTMKRLRGTSQQDSIGDAKLKIPQLVYRPGEVFNLRYAFRAPCLPRVCVHDI